MQHAKGRRPDSSLPEVVPVEILKENAIRHNDLYYKYPNPTQPFSPLPHSNQGNSSPYTSAVTPHPYQWNDSSSLGTKQVEKSSRKKFALLIALGTFILTGIAVAAGIGIPLFKLRARLNPDDYAPIQPLKVNTIKTSSYCNNQGRLSGDSLFTTQKGTASFDLKCGVILQEGLAAYDPVSNVSISKGTMRNIAAIVSYSVDDCLQACASLNAMAEDADKESPRCQSVTFIPEMKISVDLYEGNCFLKNSTLFDISQAGVNVEAVSAEVHGLRNET